MNEPVAGLSHALRVVILNLCYLGICCQPRINFRLSLLGLLCLLQEPGTEAEIKEFAKGYNAEFDLFSKIEVNGDNAHPLWKWMKAQPEGKGTFGK